MTSSVPSAPTPAHLAPIGMGRLTLLYQEALTAISRLRANRQTVADVGAFRAQMQHLLRRADEEGRAMGYDPGDLQLATFAVVALLDESALSSADATWGDWARRPLQDELFGGHMAGEWFFQHVDRLLARPDAPALADLMELHETCLLLGFRGRYGADDRGALHAVTSQLGERIRRMRGARSDFVAGWKPADDAVAARDPWVRRLTVALVATVVLAALVWGAGYFALGSAVDGVAAATGGAPAAPSR